MMRQRVRSTGPKARDEPIELRKNSVAAISMTRIRPMRSARRPATNAPMTHPSSAEETTKPITPELRSNCSRTAVTVPLMTAVSKPKRKPPSAATVARMSALPT